MRLLALISVLAIPATQARASDRTEIIAVVDRLAAGKDGKDFSAVQQAVWPDATLTMTSKWIRKPSTQRWLATGTSSSANYESHRIRQAISIDGDRATARVTTDIRVNYELGFSGITQVVADRHILERRHGEWRISATLRHIASHGSDAAYHRLYRDD